jgi:maleate isomerase
MTKKRVGLLVPAGNIVMEGELARSFPEGISLHTMRMSTHGGGTTVEGLSTMVEDGFSGALYLKECKVDLIFFGCTSGSFLHGKDFDHFIESEIEKRTGIEAYTTSHAVIDLLNFLNVKKLSILTPYIDEINGRISKFLADNGFQVLRMQGMNKIKGVDIGEIDPSETLKSAMEISHPEADALFISCTALRTFQLIPLLGKLINKRVITSNQASLWKILQKADMQGDQEILRF